MNNSTVARKDWTNDLAGLLVYVRDQANNSRLILARIEERQRRHDQPQRIAGVIAAARLVLARWQAWLRILEPLAREEVDAA